MPLVIRNMKKPRDSDLQEKSSLLKTIKVGKNISYIGEKLPLPNYTPLRYKHNSLGKIDNKRQANRSLSLGQANSSLSLHQSNGSLANKSKITLPPVPVNSSVSIKKSMKQLKLINSVQV